MGVKGLWQLLEPAGRPVSLESMENKIIAIDISIWLNQALKGFRDAHGGPVHNSHLIGLFHRLCKLLFCKIKPIFVFDGGVPQLKKQTLVDRQRAREEAYEKASTSSHHLLAHKLLSQNQASSSSTSPSSSAKATKSRAKPEQEDLFILPPMAEDLEREEDNEEQSIDFSYHEDVDKIDIESADFKGLPSEIKHEILTALKEKNKRWSQIEDLPKDSNEFSNYQMKRLLGKRKVQQKIEDTRKEMNEVKNYDLYSQFDENEEFMTVSKRIVSEDDGHLIFVKKLPKSLVDKKRLASANESPLVFDKVNSNMDTDFIIEEEEASNDFLLNDESRVNILDSSDENMKNELPDQYKHSGGFFREDSPPIIGTVNASHKEMMLLNVTMQTSSPLQSVALPSDINLEKLNPLARALESSHQDSTKDHEKSFFSKDTNTTNIFTTIPDKISYPISSSTTTLEMEKIDKQPQSSNKLENKTFQDEERIASSLNESNYQIKNKTPGQIDSTALMNEELADDIEVFSENVDLSSCEKEMTIESQNTNDTPSRGLIVTIDLDSSKEDDLFPSSTFVSSRSLQAPTAIEDPVKIVAPPIVLLDESQQEELFQFQGLQERMSITVSDHMYKECQELLKLFGVPYLVSPMEAEAQCAFLDQTDQTHGTITEDSDVWLFGGRRVYKNFFTQGKYVEFFKDTEVLAQLGLNRYKMINAAMMTGGDYTNGIDGVGPVTAMEILSEFTGEGMEPLVKFKSWWDGMQKNQEKPASHTRSKLKRFHLPESFPSRAVFEAYLHPEVDSSKETFTWGLPDLDQLRKFGQKKLGLSQSKIDEMLLPILKKLNDKQAQTRIDSYFSVNLQKHEKLFPSKRLKSAFHKLSNTFPKNSQDATKSTKNKVPTKSKKVKATASKRSISKSVRSKRTSCKSNQPQVCIELNLSENSSSSD